MSFLVFLIEIERGLNRLAKAKRKLKRIFYMELLHKDLTDLILKTYYEVYNELGYGFLEKVYQNAMYY